MTKINHQPHSLPAGTAKRNRDDHAAQRPRIAGAIAESLSRNIVTAIFAPPGSGKTRALEDAKVDLAARRLPFAAMVCTPDCADPEVFAERLRVAVGAPPGPVTPEAVIAALGALAQGPEAAHLVIDDFHLADHKPQRQLIVETFHRANGAVRVLATARHRFRCGMGSLLIDGKLEEFGLSDLAYTPLEARALFPRDLSPEEESALDVIIQRADGWAAALTIVLRRLARGERLPQIAREFSGTMREFTAYFEDAIALVPQETAEFLCCLASLDVVTSELAEAVTGRQSEFALMRAVDACPFVTTGGGVFRIHPLFRDFLAAVARDRDPGAVRHVLLAAADWHELRRQWISAAACHLKAGQSDEAAALLCRHADDIFAREGRSEALVPLLQHLTPTIRKSPGNLFWISRSVVFHGDFPRVAQLIADPEMLFGGENPLRMRLIRILLAFGFEEFERVRQEGSRWLVEAADAPPIDRITVSIAIAMSGMAMLNPIHTAAALDTARTEAARSDSQYLKAWIAIVAALHALDGGMPREALRRLEWAPSELDSGNAIRPTIELVRAAALHDCGALEDAERLLDRYLVAGLRHGVADTAIAGIRVAIAAKIRREGTDAALSLANNLENTIEQRFGPRARTLLRVLRIDAALAPTGGRIDGAALRSLADLDVLAQGTVRHCASVAEQIRLASARHHLLQGEYRQVIAITSTIMGPAATNRRFRAHADASILRVAAHLGEGDAGIAVKYLWAAIESAAPEGLVQCFIDNAVLFRLIAPALVDHARRLSGRVDPACIALAEAIAAACGIAVQASEPSEEEEAPAEPLTPAEVKVLTLAASGLKNADIAAHMLISLPTIKWHLHNVFNKWEVKTRTAAIAKARANGILA